MSITAENSWGKSCWNTFCPLTPALETLTWNKTFCHIFLPPTALWICLSSLWDLSFLEKETAAHSRQPSSCLENPWTKEPAGLQSMGSQRVRHDWVTTHSTQHSAYKLNKQGGSLQSFHTVPILNQLFHERFYCCFLTWIQVSQETDKAVWYFISLRIFRSLLWSTQSKALTWSMKHIFFWNSLAYSMIQWMLAIWSQSSPYQQLNDVNGLNSPIKKQR